jgi:hypothetical protein
MRVTPCALCPRVRGSPTHNRRSVQQHNRKDANDSLEGILQQELGQYLRGHTNVKPTCNTEMATLRDSLCGLPDGHALFNELIQDEKEHRAENRFIR